MNRGWMTILWVPLLALAIGIVGCEVNQAALGPSADAHLDRGQATELKRVRGGIPAHVTTSTVTAQIGPEGGILEHAGHRLTVPAGAVSERSLFRMKLASDGYVELDLTATGTGARRGKDVGELGFAVPVELQISYAYAEGIADPEALRVAWVKGDGSIVVLPTELDASSQTATAELDHFSKYALVFD